MGKERQAMSKYHKLIFPPEGKTTGQTSNQSQGHSTRYPIPQAFVTLGGKANIQMMHQFIGQSTIEPLGQPCIHPNVRPMG